MARPKLLSTDFDEYVNTHSVYGMIDAELLATLFEVSRATVYRALKKIGLHHASNHLLEITKSYLAGDSVRALKELNGISQVTINAFFRRHKIPQRNATYIFNHSYFESIDSEDKAYFLGFFIADGCVHGNTINLALAARDIDLIEKFRSALEGNFKIHNGMSKSFGAEHPCVSMQISSSKMISDLLALGVSERKTETASFPEIREDLVRHMLRGYLDGDGSFCKYLNRGIHTKYSIGFCGSPEALEFIRNHLYEIYPSKGSLSKRHKESESRVLALMYSGGLTTKAYLEYFYRDCTVYLDRKFKKCQSFYVT